MKGGIKPCSEQQRGCWGVSQVAEKLAATSDGTGDGGTGTGGAEWAFWLRDGDGVDGRAAARHGTERSLNVRHTCIAVVPQ